MKEDDAVDLLREVALFALLLEPDLRALATIATTRRFTAGQYVFYQGDPGHAMYVIAEGRAHVELSSGEGDTVILAMLEPGDVFGELALIDGGSRSASVIAVENVELLMVNRASLLDLLVRQPALLRGLLGSLGLLIRRLSDQVGDLVWLDLPQRVAKAIVQLAKSAPSGPELVVDLSMTQSQLASMVGGSRQSVNQILQRFEQRGLLQREGSRITIVDLRTLQRRAGM